MYEGYHKLPLLRVETILQYQRSRRSNGPNGGGDGSTALQTTRGNSNMYTDGRLNQAVLIVEVIIVVRQQCSGAHSNCFECILSRVLQHTAKLLCCIIGMVSSRVPATTLL